VLLFNRLGRIGTKIPSIGPAFGRGETADFAARRSRDETPIAPATAASRPDKNPRRVVAARATSIFSIPFIFAVFLATELPL
jgi:hypothetical protein